MPEPKNCRIVLASRPVGKPAQEDFRWEETVLPAPQEGQALLRTIYLSLDPYMRGRMSDAPSYAEPVGIGEVMEGATVCEVVESKSPDVRAGDVVLARTGWQKYAVSNAKGLRKLDRSVAPYSAFLGVLGMPGLTAYSGLLEIGQPKPGETVVVAAASGAVGAVVGQIAKLKGARVVGIAGGPEKCHYLTAELGFDAWVDRNRETFADDLKQACPAGIDVYFENVGGPVFDAVLPLLNNFARIPVCGLIAQYNATELPPGPNRLPLLMRAVLTKRFTLRGFIVTDFVSHYGQFVRDMAGWLQEGKMKYREDLVEGLENAVDAFQGLLEGKNFGKLVVKVGPEPGQ